jgi:hypothetical protein
VSVETFGRWHYRQTAVGGACLGFAHDADLLSYFSDLDVYVLEPNSVFFFDPSACRHFFFSDPDELGPNSGVYLSQTRPDVTVKTLS